MIIGTPVLEKDSCSTVRPDRNSANESDAGNAHAVIEYDNPTKFAG